MAITLGAADLNDVSRLFPVAESVADVDNLISIKNVLGVGGDQSFLRPIF